MQKTEAKKQITGEEEFLLENSKIIAKSFLAQRARDRQSLDGTLYVVSENLHVDLRFSDTSLEYLAEQFPDCIEAFIEEALANKKTLGLVPIMPKSGRVVGNHENTKATATVYGWNNIPLPVYGRVQ
jgi:hypothetical protein